jgi:hypothetical protein
MLSQHPEVGAQAVLPIGTRGTCTTGEGRIDHHAIARPDPGNALTDLVHHPRSVGPYYMGK